MTEVTLTKPLTEVDTAKLVMLLKKSERNNSTSLKTVLGNSLWWGGGGRKVVHSQFSIYIRTSNLEVKGEPFPKSYIQCNSLDCFDPLLHLEVRRYD